MDFVTLLILTAWFWNPASSTMECFPEYYYDSTKNTANRPATGNQVTSAADWVEFEFLADNNDVYKIGCMSFPLNAAGSSTGGILYAPPDKSKYLKPEDVNNMRFGGNNTAQTLFGIEGVAWQGVMALFGIYDTNDVAVLEIFVTVPFTSDNFLDVIQWNPESTRRVCVGPESYNKRGALGKTRIRCFRLEDPPSKAATKLNPRPHREEVKNPQRFIPTANKAADGLKNENDFVEFVFTTERDDLYTIGNSRLEKGDFYAPPDKSKVLTTDQVNKLSFRLSSKNSSATLGAYGSGILSGTEGEFKIYSNGILVANVYFNVPYVGRNRLIVWPTNTEKTKRVCVGPETYHVSKALGRIEIKCFRLK